MKKIKPNLKKMFGFHTIVLAALVVLQSQTTIEGRLQTKHNHLSHNSNNKQHYNYHINNNDDNKQHHHKHHHHPQQQQQQPTTPSIDVIHDSPLLNTDNEFYFKPHLVKDVLSKTENDKSILATTSSSTLLYSSHPIEQNDLNTQSISSNSAMKLNVTPTLSNYIKEHTYYNEYNKMSPTPMPAQQPTWHIGNHSTNTSQSSYSNPGKSSKLNLATVDQVTNEQQLQHQQHNYSTKQEYDNEQHHEQQPQQNDDDYYEDYSEDYSDIADDADDTDATSDEDDNSLSDHPYARITRSKHYDDYADDEPYRSETNDLQMQRDAAPGSLTEQKYAEVGNEKAVVQARERYIQEQKRPRTPHELATAHWHRMIQATKCRKPFPRVIPVSNNTSKHYEPYATILHRCGEDTGCCGSTASVCTVKRYEIVMVYVFSYDFNYRKEIEALPMQNHTECHCVNRGSLHDSMPRNKRSEGAEGGVGRVGYVHQLQLKLQKQPQQHKTQDAVANKNNYNFHHHQQHNLQNVLGCHCPRHFNVFEEDVERLAHLPRPHSVYTRKCRCDCLINNQTCLRFKHGDEGFSLEDRKCILEHNCKPPVCSYGGYNLQKGRCPGYTSHLSQMI